MGKEIVFRFAVCMFESPSFRQYCMFQGEKVSKLSYKWWLWLI